MLDYRELETIIIEEAEAVAAAGKDWSAAEVAARFREIAEQLAMIRKQHATGVDASMGKRSGIQLDG